MSCISKLSLLPKWHQELKSNLWYWYFFAVKTLKYGAYKTFTGNIKICLWKIIPLMGKDIKRLRKVLDTAQQTLRDTSCRHLRGFSQATCSLKLLLLQGRGLRIPEPQSLIFWRVLRLTLAKVPQLVGRNTKAGGIGNITWDNSNSMAPFTLRHLALLTNLRFH